MPMNRNVFPARRTVALLFMLLLALPGATAVTAHESQPLLEQQPGVAPDVSFALPDQATDSTPAYMPSDDAWIESDEASIVSPSMEVWQQRSEDEALVVEDTQSSDPDIERAIAVYPVDGFSLGTVEAGCSLSLGVPMQIATASAVYTTNADASGYGVNFAPYGDSNSFGQSAAQRVDWMHVEMTTGVDAPTQSPLCSDGTFTPEAVLIEQGINYGYATFSGLYLPETTPPGSYNIWFTAKWPDTSDGALRYTSFPLTLTISSPAGATVTEAAPDLGSDILAEGDSVNQRDDQATSDSDPTLISTGDLGLSILQQVTAVALDDEPFVVSPETDDDAPTVLSADNPQAGFGDVLVTEDESEDDATADADTTVSTATMTLSDAVSSSTLIFQPVVSPVVSGVDLYNTSFDSVHEHELLTLPVATRIQYGDMLWESNAAPDGTWRMFEGTLDPGDFTQQLPDGIAELTVCLNLVQFEDEDFPFTLSDDAPTEATILHDGVNYGYALFTGLRVREGAEAGGYPITFTIRWKAALTQADTNTSDTSGPDRTATSTGWLSRSDNFLALLFGIASAQAEDKTTVESFSVVAEQYIILGEVIDDPCTCCVHCPACYDDAGERLSDSCACLDGNGLSVCQCPCVAASDTDEAAETTDESDAQVLLAETEDTDTSEADESTVLCDDDCPCGCQAAPMSIVVSTYLADTRVPPDGWTFSNGADDTASYLVRTVEKAVISGYGHTQTSDTRTVQEAIVFSFAQFKTASQTSGIQTVYIGSSTDANTQSGALYDGQPVNNGVLVYPSAGLQVIPANTNYVLDGSDPLQPGTIATVQDGPDSATGLLYVQTAGTYTLQNINWDGVNYYGAIRTVVANVYLRFNNFTYLGRQMLHAALDNTVAVFDGCTITIQKNPRSTASAQELAEIHSVAFTGADTVIHSTATAGPLFNIYGSTGTSGTSFFLVEEGTNVSITSSVYLFDDALSTMTIDGTLTTVLTSIYGGVTYAGVNLNAVTIGSNGTMDISYTTALGGYSALRATTANVNGSLRIRHNPAGTAYYALYASTLNVNEGSVFDVRRTAANSGIGYAIYTVSAYFNNPKRAAIYNNSGYLTYTTPKMITTQSLNVWTAAPSLDIYDIASPPTYVWTPQGNGTLTFTSTTNTNSSVSGLGTNNVGASPTAPALTHATLGMYTAKTAYVVMGQMSISVARVYYGQSAVTGSSSGSQAVAYQYAINDSGVSQTGTVLRQTGIGGGGFALSLADGETWAPVLSNVYVMIFDDGLFAFQYPNSPVQGALGLTSVPDLSFETLGFISVENLRARVTPAVMIIEGSDSRGYYDSNNAWVSFPWTISVRQEGMFTSTQDGGETLDSSMVFIKDGVMTSLGQGDVVVATGQSDTNGDTFTVRYDVDEGIHFLQVPHDGTPGHRYVGVVVWTISE